VITKNTYFSGTGRRKEAVAQVRLALGNGSILVDGQDFSERFTREGHKKAILLPFNTTDTMGKYSASIKVMGGGISGQAGAISHGIARALVELDENYKPALKAAGLLTRDARTKERKKPGLKRARKAPQYTKR